jgi:hypothetical protein
MSRNISRIALATVLLSLTVPLAAAPRPRVVVQQARRGSPTADDFSTAVWKRVTAVWASIGAIIDPNGKPAPDPKGTTTSAGTVTNGDIGAILDPDG